jgi:hypothetical protein
MDDTLSITFTLAAGKTPNGERQPMRGGEPLWYRSVDARIDPDKEDLGVGSILESPDILAADFAWVDDYDDSRKPYLALLGTYCAGDPPSGDAEKYRRSEVRPSAVDVPYYASGTRIAEWIVQYMQDNVYHQKHFNKE